MKIVWGLGVCNIINIMHAGHTGNQMHLSGHLELRQRTLAQQNGGSGRPALPMRDYRYSVQPQRLLPAAPHASRLREVDLSDDHHHGSSLGDSTTTLSSGRGGWLPRDVVSRVRSLFLPEGFPSSVTPDYLPYQLWSMPTHITVGLCIEMHPQGLPCMRLSLIPHSAVIRMHAFDEDQSPNLA